MERPSILENPAQFTGSTFDTKVRHHTVCRKPFSTKLPTLGGYTIVVPDGLPIHETWKVIRYYKEGDVVRDNNNGTVFVHDDLGDTDIQGIPCDLKFIND